MRSQIGWGGERNILYKEGCGNLSLEDDFKTLRGSSEEKVQKRQYWLAMSLDELRLLEYLFHFTNYLVLIQGFPFVFQLQP